MIEKVVLNYLLERMGVPVYMEEPEKPPQSYVIIEKTGGGTRGGTEDGNVGHTVLW